MLFNKSVNSIAYITIGTGLGIGIICEGKLVHGLLHPEGGHIRVNRHKDDEYKGCCRIHGDCLEGMVTNHALKERKGFSSADHCSDIEGDDVVWDIIAYYIAQGCLSLLYLLSIEKIVIGINILK